ncbi:MAG: hypothetical protein RRY20_08030 [Bilophila sp.]
MSLIGVAGLALATYIQSRSAAATALASAIALVSAEPFYPENALERTL